jgi:6-phosphofructokinase 1
MAINNQKRIGVLTSGGDAPGMNAAVRAVVRTALFLGARVYAVKNGYQGLVNGGDEIVHVDAKFVTGIIHDGGTILGSARCKEFRTPEGRRKAIQNMKALGIHRLVVIGGDGSLTGAMVLHEEWSELQIVGLVGSIDNDMYGTDLTIGADTALHRIVEAIDAISDTAASHQRAFVVKVMGRRCGYLALMSGLITGADWVLIPEKRPDAAGWKDEMCRILKQGLDAGRRASIVVLSEGVKDSMDRDIDSPDVRDALQSTLGMEVRVTELGHVQRGGNPSAFDRIQATLLGHAAARALIDGKMRYNPVLIGMEGFRIISSSLKECLERNRYVSEAVDNGNHAKAMELRGRFFAGAFKAKTVLKRPVPVFANSEDRPGLAVMHAGAPAPGMNTAVRALVRLGIESGFRMFGIHRGFDGLIAGDIQQLDWMSVNGASGMGGAFLGTKREIPDDGDVSLIERQLEEFGIGGLVIVGGLSGYFGANVLMRNRVTHPRLAIPIVCVPATISNNLPNTDLSIGVDTALNNIIEAVDKIKQSAVALQRCFLVEVAGRYCGYLALMSGLATGAEQVYLHEKGVTLQGLLRDIRFLKRSFSEGRHLALMLRCERAHPCYDTEFMRTLFEAESGDDFNVRHALLGHLQLGGSPAPLDRILAIRFADNCVRFLSGVFKKGNDTSAVFMGIRRGKIRFHPLAELESLIDKTHRRPLEQWWLRFMPVARILV